MSAERGLSSPREEGGVEAPVERSLEAKRRAQPRSARLAASQPRAPAAEEAPRSKRPSQRLEPHLILPVETDTKPNETALKQAEEVPCTGMLSRKIITIPIRK